MQTYHREHHLHQQWSLTPTLHSNSITKHFRYLNEGILNLIAGYFGGWVFPYMSRILYDDSSILGTSNSWWFEAQKSKEFEESQVISVHLGIHQLNEPPSSKNYTPEKIDELIILTKMMVWKIYLLYGNLRYGVSKTSGGVPIGSIYSI